MRLIRCLLYLFNRRKEKTFQVKNLTGPFDWRLCQRNETREFHWLLKIVARLQSELLSLNENFTGLFFRVFSRPVHIQKALVFPCHWQGKKRTKARRYKIVEHCGRVCQRGKCGGIQSIASEWRNFQMTKNVLEEISTKPTFIRPCNWLSVLLRLFFEHTLCWKLNIKELRRKLWLFCSVLQTP